MKLQKKDANGSKTYNIEECLEKISGINGTVDDINAKLEKLSGIAANAEVNQYAFSNVNVKTTAGTTTIAADNKTDTLSIEAGDNIILTPDTTNDKITIAAKVDMSALDDKLDKTGGTLTGNLTGKYITGTWLQTTEATDLGRTPGKIAVLDDSGWVYYRTPAEMLADLGADYIVSQGTIGIWTYRKWSSGIAECWGVQSYSTIDVSSEWGSIYESDGRKLAFPSGLFIAAPEYCSITYGGGSLAVLSIELLGLPSESETQTFYLTRATAGTIINVKIQAHTIGRWK